MALQSGIAEQSGDRPSRDRETPAPRSRPEIGIAALLQLARLTTETPEGHRRRADAAIARLYAARELRELVDQAMELDVTAALAAGGRFEDIGRALGLSRSAAHRRFQHLNPRPNR